jgi:hypothetical protein
MSRGHVCAEVLVLLYAGYGVLGIYLEHKLHKFRVRHIESKQDRFDPTFYSIDARPWIDRSRLWQKSLTYVWIGLGLAIWVICSLI